MRTIVPGCITSARLHLDSRRYQQGHLSCHPQKEPRSTQAAKLAESLLALSQQKRITGIGRRELHEISISHVRTHVSESQPQALWLGIEALLGIDLECVSEAC